MNTDRHGSGGQTNASLRQLKYEAWDAKARAAGLEAREDGVVSDKANAGDTAAAFFLVGTAGMIGMLIGYLLAMCW